MQLTVQANEGRMDLEHRPDLTVQRRVAARVALFKAGERVVDHSGSEGTVLKDQVSSFHLVDVQFDDEVDEDGRKWPWRSEASSLTRNGSAPTG